MTEKERDELYEKIRHNSEQENHWKAQRWFWFGTVVLLSVSIVATVVMAWLKTVS